jgi:hypothetical protein
MRAARVDRRLLLALLGLAATGAAAAELATLFHSPEERARLDRLRRGDPVVQRPAEARAPGELTGFVKRSDGRGTAFVDGIAVPVDPGSSALLEPRSVRAYSGRKSDDLKIERKPAR